MPDGSSVPEVPADQHVARDEGPRNGSSGPGGWSWFRFGRNAAIIGPAVGLSAWFAVEGVVPNVVPKNFGVVEPGVIYRSGELTPAALRDVIAERGIRTVIDFGAHDNDPAAERREQRVAESMGVRRVVLPLYGDATGDPNRYVDALRIMTEPGAGPVLVHCAAGAQRTGCAVALYRDIVQGWEPDAALLEARDFRHDPVDNPRLTEMFETWRDEIERAYEQGGTIEFSEGE